MEIMLHCHPMKHKSKRKQRMRRADGSGVSVFGRVGVSKGRIVGVWERAWVRTAISEKGLARVWQHIHNAKITLSALIRSQEHYSVILRKKSYQTHVRRRTLKWEILYIWSKKYCGECHKLCREHFWVIIHPENPRKVKINYIWIRN